MALLRTSRRSSASVHNELGYCESGTARLPFCFASDSMKDSSGHLSTFGTVVNHKTSLDC